VIKRWMCRVGLHAGRGYRLLYIDVCGERHIECPWCGKELAEGMEGW